MNFLIIIAILIIVAGILVVLKAKQQSKVDSLLKVGKPSTSAERSFLGVLDQPLEGRYRLLARSG